MQTDTSHAADASRERRPGIPEMSPPAPVGNAHWLKPDRQRPEGEVLKDPAREELTPTFGDTVPPRGLSGALRRAAYRLPDYEVRRWLLLLIADRVDAVEHNLARIVTGRSGKSGAQGQA